MTSDEMDMKKYVASYGYCCPICKAHGVRFVGRFRLTRDAEVTHKVWCQVCNATWTEFYKLFKYENLKDGEVK